MWRCSKDVIKNPPKEKKYWSNVDLYLWLEKKVSPTPLGMDVQHLPNRNWLIAVIYNFQPDLDLFIGCESIDPVVGIPVHLFEKFKFFDPYLTQSKTPVIKKTDEQRKSEAAEKLKRRICVKERRETFLRKEISKLNSAISDYQASYEMDA